MVSWDGNARLMWMVAYNGLGRHQASLSNTERTNLLRWLWISIILYHIGLGLAKLSIASAACVYH